MVIVYTLLVIFLVGLVIAVSKIIDVIKDTNAEIIKIKNNSGRQVEQSEDSPWKTTWDEVESLKFKLNQIKSGDGIILRAQFNAAKKQFALGMIDTITFRQIINRISDRYEKTEIHSH